MDLLQLLDKYHMLYSNPSFAKLFGTGTHTVLQGGRGRGGGTTVQNIIDLKTQILLQAYLYLWVMTVFMIQLL